jgi:hypothetical protein
MAKQGMGVREYARHRGMAHSSVIQAIEEGRISKLPDGSIDPTAADRQWAENTKKPGVGERTMKDLKLRHEVALLNQKVKEGSGKFVPIESVLSIINGLTTDLREQLINRCHRLAPSLANQSDISKIARLLEEDTKQMITEYRNGFRERLRADSGRSDNGEEDL